MSDEEIMHKARALHHAAAADLDEVTTSRLAAARRRALAAAGTARLPRLWVPAVAFASVAMVALGVGLVMPRPGTAPEVPGVEAYELLLAEEELDFFEEDAEFYDWAVMVADAG